MKSRPSPGSTIASWAILLIALAAFSYTIVRACTVSFSWDEAYTFMNHVRTDILYLSEYDTAGANHHLLNVWSMWVCMKLFGTSELALRIPNLLAHALYLYGSARIASKALRPALAVLVFMLMNIHPYLLDFFSLARGYGISNGMMMLALWQLYRFSVEGNQARHALLGTLFAALAAVAHTIMLNFLFGMVAAILGTWLWGIRKNGMKPYMKPTLATLGIVLACFAVVVPNAIGMYHGGALFYGSDGPWQGMMGSLAEKFCYHFVEPFAPLTVMTWILMVVLGWSVVVLVEAQRKGWDGTPLILGMVVAATILLSLAVQDLLLDVLWPCTRTALFIVPLLAYLLVVSLLTWRGAMWVPTLLGVLLVIPLTMHMARSFNLAYVIEWRPSGQFEHIIDLIEKDHVPLTAQRPTVTVSIGGQCSPSFGYYNHTRGLQWLVNIDPPTQDSFPRCDYYSVEWHAEKWIDRENWTLIRRFDETGTALYRDERLRKEHLEVLYEAHQDMERIGMVGTTDTDHVSGKRCVLFDRVVRGVDTLQLAVNDDWGDGQLLLLGSAMVKQSDDRNWMSLVIRLIRNGVVVDEGVAGSIPQTRRFNEWNKVTLAFRPRVRVLPGDQLKFMVLPYGSVPPMLVDDIELLVCR